MATFGQQTPPVRHAAPKSTSGQTPFLLLCLKGGKPGLWLAAFSFGRVLNIKTSALPCRSPCMPCFRHLIGHMLASRRPRYVMRAKITQRPNAIFITLCSALERRQTRALACGIFIWTRLTQLCEQNRASHHGVCPSTQQQAAYVWLWIHLSRLASVELVRLRCSCFVLGLASTGSAGSKYTNEAAKVLYKPFAMHLYVSALPKMRSTTYFNPMMPQSP